jgi:hypothetical protein
VDDFTRGLADERDPKASRNADQLRSARKHMEHRAVQQHEQRRFEDDVREELRDSRARTIRGGRKNR